MKFTMRKKRDWKAWFEVGVFKRVVVLRNHEINRWQIMGLCSTGAPVFIEAARGKCQIRAWTDFNQLALFLEAIGVQRYEVHNKAAAAA